MRATVSETVALTVAPNFTHGDVAADVLTNGNTVRITLSSDEAKNPVIRVPLLVRSNSAFKISAAVESTTAGLTQLSIADVRATGTLVSPEAVSGLNVPQDETTWDDSLPRLVASGPRVSLGGGLNSSNNALEVTVLIRLKPQTAHGWLVHLTFVATPE